MKLLEKVLYSAILFTAVYVIVSVGLRVFELTSDYASHMIGGILSTTFGVGLFILLLLRKNDNIGGEQQW